MSRLSAVSLLQIRSTRPLILLALIVGLNFMLFVNLDALSGWDEVARLPLPQFTPSVVEDVPSSANDPVYQLDGPDGLDVPHQKEGIEAGKSVLELDSDFLSDRVLKQLLADMRERVQDNADDHLFSELRGPGEKKLREVAVKGGIFQKVLRTWEKLNYFAFEGALYPRPEVTSRLKAFEDGSALDTLDQFRRLVDRLGSRLFPWRFPNAGDFSTLHTSYHGRGIVLTGGSPQVKHLRTLIQSIRKLGCRLPIELLYLGNNDLSEVYRADLAKLENVVVKDMSLVVNHAAWEVRGWALKPYAMLASSFREVIFIDADVLFLVDPETLFATEEYISSGTLFFKDRTLFPRDNKPFIQAILPNISERFKKENRFWTGSSAHMMESGVVVMDKLRHFVPLMMAARLNGPDRDGQGEGTARVKGLYEFIQGDKETFWLGFEMIGNSDYRFHPVPMGNLGKLKVQPTQATSPDGRDEHIICSAQILHYDGAGKPIWLNGGLKTSKVLHDAPWAEFDVHLREPNEPQDSGLSHLWDIEPGNIMCLRNHSYSNFTKHERDTFAMLTELAKQNERFVLDSERALKEEKKKKKQK